MHFPPEYSNLLISSWNTEFVSTYWKASDLKFWGNSDKSEVWEVCAYFEELRHNCSFIWISMGNLEVLRYVWGPIFCVTIVQLASLILRSGEDESLSWTRFHILRKFASTFTLSQHNFPSNLWQYSSIKYHSFHDKHEIMTIVMHVMKNPVIMSAAPAKNKRHGFLLGKGQPV